MEIIEVSGDQLNELSEMAAKFRTTMLAVQGIARIVEPTEGLSELKASNALGWPIYRAVLEGLPKGYLVCRIEGDGVWIEALYVDSSVRRQGIATELFHRAEEIAQDRGEGSVHIQIPPSHQVMLAFLRSQGYNRLHLVEIRKSLPHEKLDHSIRLDGNRFRAPRPLSANRLLDERDPAGKRKKRRKKKKLNQTSPGIAEWGEACDQDEYFYFIAGFTANEVPFGITWEQAYEDGLLSAQEIHDRGLALAESDASACSDEDLPF